MMRHLLGSIAIIALTFTGCSGTSEKPRPVVALIAASTKDAVQELAAKFTADTGVEVRLSAEDSSRLAEQIVNGAPADLFLSANQKWADHVRDKGFATEATVLLGNTLVLVVPRGNPAKVSAPADLVGASVRKLALAGPTVPAGIYGRQALTHLKLLSELEQQKKIVSGENVRVTLSYVERGEAEAGIVYGTDARITDLVEVVYTFETSSHDPVVYPLVLLKDAGQSPGARKFFDYLRGPTAAEVFRRYGFTPLATK
jgi:molybdate transport system substrate-binding protein